jgi:hypothetical protein
MPLLAVLRPLSRLLIGRALGLISVEDCFQFGEEVMSRRRVRMLLLLF